MACLECDVNYWSAVDFYQCHWGTDSRSSAKKAVRVALKPPSRNPLLTGLLMEPYAYATPVYLTCHKSSLGVCLVLRCCMELGYTQFDVHRNESKLPHVFYDSTSPKAERCCMSNSIRHSVALIIKSRQLKRTRIWTKHVLNMRTYDIQLNLFDFITTQQDNCVSLMHWHHFYFDCFWGLNGFRQLCE